MKCMVDSKEFSTRVRQASRWTAKTGMEASECIMLTAEGNFLMVRTTTNDSDCLLAVNAFDVEEGMIITKASILENFSWDTGGWLTISGGKKLELNYENFGAPRLSVVSDDVAKGYPRLMEIEAVANLPPQILLRAASFTGPFAETGKAVSSAIHLIQHGDLIAVVGTDGFGGFRGYVPGVIPNTISIEAASLIPALTVIPAPVNIGISEHRIEVSNGKNRIQFSSMVCPDPSSFIQGFEYETMPGISLDKERFDRLAFLCEKAALASKDSRVRIGGSPVVVEICGREVSVPEFTLHDGEMPKVVFPCLGLSGALKKVMDAKEYAIAPMEHGGMIRCWYIDAEDGRYFTAVCDNQSWDSNEL